MADLELDPAAAADDEDDDAPEDAPLLSPTSPSGWAPPRPPPHARGRIPAARRWQARSPATIVRLVALVKFCVTASGMLMLVPIYRLVEDALCHAHFGDDSPGIIDEMRCKVDEVQSRLAFLLGWLGLLNSVITLLVAFPYGMMADKIGRRPTALMAYTGLSVSFLFSPFILGTLKYQVRRNPAILMIGAVFHLFGGGIHVLFATLYAVAADVSDDKDKTSHFLYLTFGTVAGGLLGPFLAGLLMESFGPWVPIYIPIALSPFVFAIFLFIPETLAVDAVAAAKAQRTAHRAPPTLLLQLRAHVAGGLAELTRSFGMVRDRNIPLILVTFFIQNAKVAGHMGILAQYISKYFGWKLAETSLLLSPLGLLNLAILVSIPRVSRLLMSRFGFGTFTKDLFLTKVSNVIIIVSTLIMGFSHSIVLFLFGLFVGTFATADSPLARATVTHYVHKDYTSRLYALIGMVEVLGTFIGSPVLAWFFSQGLQRKGLYAGLPWFYLCFLATISYIALLFVRPPAKATYADVTFSDDDITVTDEDLLHTA